LEADGRNAGSQQRGEGGDAALGLAPRLIDEPDREEGTPAAERATVAVRRRRQVHAVAGGREHGERGGDILRLEIAIEGVGEERHLARAAAGNERRRLAPPLGPPARPAAARAEPRLSLWPFPPA